jgi:ergothioneine biosynthesis protein EgtB
MVLARSDIRLKRAESLVERFQRIRSLSLELTAPLSKEDQVIQTIPEVSPTKWHLAHATWFFEHFCLSSRSSNYRLFDERFHFLFNSYYQTVGEMHSRQDRGLLSRPTVAEIRDYRQHVDEAIVRALEANEHDEELAFLVSLGLNHEQQHQELMLTDIKHVFFSNPLGPAYHHSRSSPTSESVPLSFLSYAGGQFDIGAEAIGFCFDNETPRHTVTLREHALTNRLVTNEEYRQFIQEGGYDDPAVWLSDGWSTIKNQGWRHPLYWSNDLGREFTLAGWQELEANTPVTHVSYYEADAFARWAGARLPAEEEWEVTASPLSIEGNFLESNSLNPVASSMRQCPDQLYGDVWEWTASPYNSYPGFKPLAGSLGEYNGKFMCNQIVVRGGSCVTQLDHIRPTYRSFFYPHDRWQFLGFRLAKDL